MLVPNSTSTVSLLSAKGQDILTSLGSPGPKMASEGRIEHTLLDGEFSVRPNRPKTFARNHTIPHKSYRCFYLRQRARTPWDSGPLDTYAVAGRFLDRLDGGDVVRLHALLTLGRLVGDLGTLIEALEAVARYTTVVDEEILATLVGGDEAVALL